MGVGVLQLWQAGATLHCRVRAAHCGGYSCNYELPDARALVVAAYRLSSCGI